MPIAIEIGACSKGSLKSSCAAPLVLGRVVVWLADGYRRASPLERLLILPSWAVFRAVFIVGWALAHLLHSAARRSLERPVDLV